MTQRSARAPGEIEPTDDGGDALWFLVVNCTSQEEALGIGRRLIEAGLAQCVNVSAMMQTLYMWEGALVEDVECRLMVKLPAGRREQARAMIAEAHSFEVPAIYGWPVAYASERYREYLLGGA